MIAYVIYRIIVDSKTTGDKHPLYPFISSPGNSMFPADGNITSWLSYIFILLGLVVFVILLFYENSEIEQLLINISGIFLFIGLIFSGINKIKSGGNTSGK
jgi:hypothetical protein